MSDRRSLLLWTSQKKFFPTAGVTFSCSLCETVPLELLSVLFLEFQKLSALESNSQKPVTMKILQNFQT
ncbi:hypothetical protein BV372_07980 [Nostoc sp. T09]|nr:hypothetical protein BV372_07980 [Nostoc sp. T09]